MQESAFLQILRKIEVCIKKNSRDIALEYVKLEINNLTGLTKKNVKIQSITIMVIVVEIAVM